MIEYISGRFSQKNPASVVVDVQGIGFQVLISLTTYAALESKEEGMLLTHYSVSVDVRSGESRHQIIGFSTSEERELFRKLIAISGISTSIALMVLSNFKPSEFFQIVVNGDAKTLTTVKGVGPKMAQKIVHELREKLADQETVEDGDSSEGNTLRQEALSALTALGFDRAASVKVINKLLQDKEKPDNLEQLVKQALKQL